MSAQPRITKARLLFYRELDKDVDVLGTIVPGDKNISVCHHFVYSYLKEIGILSDIYFGNDKASQVYLRNGFSLVSGPPVTGDIILLGGESHSLIALDTNIWVGVNNLGFFANSMTPDECVNLPKRCVMEIQGEGLAVPTLNLKHYPGGYYPVSLQVFRHTGHVFPSFDRSKINRGKLWQPFLPESGGCCSPM